MLSDNQKINTLGSAADTSDTACIIFTRKNKTTAEFYVRILGDRVEAVNVAFIAVKW